MTDFTPPERISITTNFLGFINKKPVFPEDWLICERPHDDAVEYIRADLVDSLAKKSLIADNKRLTEEIEAAKRQGAIEALEKCWNDGKDSIDVALAVNRNLSALKAEADSSSFQKND